MTVLCVRAFMWTGELIFFENSPTDAVDLT